MGWSSNEDLVCILEEGTMAVYNIHGYLHYSRPISRVSFVTVLYVIPKSIMMLKVALTFLYRLSVDFPPDHVYFSLLAQQTLVPLYSLNVTYTCTVRNVSCMYLLANMHCYVGSPRKSSFGMQVFSHPGRQ